MHLIECAVAKIKPSKENFIFLMLEIGKRENYSKSEIRNNFYKYVLSNS
jgi:hypothetical protein